jgi:hypothetical protein
MARAIEAAQAQARETLAQMKNEKTRGPTVQKRFPEIVRKRNTLENRRRERARTPEGRAEASEIWKRVKELERDLLEKEVQWILDQIQLLDLHYYDSRGALQPWAVALGGETLYNRMIQQAAIEPETS